MNYKSIMLFLDKLFMNDQQKYWIDQLAIKHMWKINQDNLFSDSVITSDGYSAYLDTEAITIIDKNYKTVCEFNPDWFGSRGRLSKELLEYLKI